MPRTKKIDQSSLIIIYELSMMSQHAMNPIDEVFNRLTDKNDAFGSQVFLNNGSLLPTTNVIMKGERNYLHETSIK